MKLLYLIFTYNAGIATRMWVVLRAHGNVVMNYTSYFQYIFLSGLLFIHTGIAGLPHGASSSIKSDVLDAATVSEEPTVARMWDGLPLHRTSSYQREEADVRSFHSGHANIDMIIGAPYGSYEEKVQIERHRGRLHNLLAEICPALITRSGDENNLGKVLTESLEHMNRLVRRSYFSKESVSYDVTMAVMRARSRVNALFANSDGSQRVQERVNTFLKEVGTRAQHRGCFEAGRRNKTAWTVGVCVLAATVIASTAYIFREKFGFVKPSEDPAEDPVENSDQSSTQTEAQTSGDGPAVPDQPVTGEPSAQPRQQAPVSSQNPVVHMGQRVSQPHQQLQPQQSIEEQPEQPVPPVQPVQLGSSNEHNRNSQLSQLARAPGVAQPGASAQAPTQRSASPTSYVTPSVPGLVPRSQGDSTPQVTCCLTSHEQFPTPPRTPASSELVARESSVNDNPLAVIGQAPSGGSVDTASTTPCSGGLDEQRGLVSDTANSNGSESPDVARYGPQTMGETVRWLWNGTGGSIWNSLPSRSSLSSITCRGRAPKVTPNSQATVGPALQRESPPTGSLWSRTREAIWNSLPSLSSVTCQSRVRKASPKVKVD